MKLFILGLDGATFNCLNPLMDEGVIPNIKNLCSAGAHGPLKTIFPPVTAPAWLALATGLNPGKTGVFDYINKTYSDDHSMAPVSSAHYGKRAVWNILNNEGHKVGIFNYPTLSPPPAVDGFAVTGMGGSGKDNFCFPSDLENELNQITNGYERNLNLRSPKYKRNINLFFEDLNRLITKQATALKFLVTEKESDFFFGVFSFTDWMQHVLWKFIDSSHPLHDPKASASVQKKYKDIWRRIDQIIGELLDLLPDETTFMIVSDHGAGPIDSVFHPNRWLAEKGWLEKKKLGWKGVIASSLKLFSSGSDNKYASKISSFLKNRILKINSSMDMIDLENSLAFSPEHNTMFGCINLTEKGKTLSGFKDQLLEGIRKLPEMIDGVDQVEIILPEQAYSGPYISLSPDIFFILNNYRTTVEIDLSSKIFIPSPSIEMRTGGHLPEGIFIAKGDLCKNAILGNTSILDIAPTILALYGIEISSQLDGRFISEAFKDEALKTLNVIIREDKEVPDDIKIGNEQADMEEMRKLLKSLGYL